MKTKIMHRKIHAYRTGDPGEVLRLIEEAEKITMPDTLYNIGADIVATVKANVRESEADDTAAVYLMRIAYVLHREERLVEAPPKPPRPKKKRPEGGGHE